jgi:protein-S-isoprenylcysteine O-methyltransferase Ste14
VAYASVGRPLSFTRSTARDMFRWLALAVLVGAATVSGYHRRQARIQGETIRRRREGLPLMGGRALVALPLFGGAAAYIVDPRSMAWASFEVPVWSRWLGVGLGLITVPTVHWVLGTLGHNVSATVLTKHQHELVMRGPYRWIRHPLYTTGVALFVALGLIAANWFILLFAILALVSIRLVIVPLEERELLARFGSEYQQYIGRTGAMLPRLRGDGRSPSCRPTDRRRG